MDRLWTPWRYNYITQSGKGKQREGVPETLAAWPGDHGCVFCNLIAAVRYAVEHGISVDTAEREARVIFRAEHCFICLNAFPYSTGHVMIVPYEHQHALGNLSPDAAAESMALAQRMARVLETVYQPDGMNFGMNVGKAAGAGVAGHLHLHALPRWVGDTNFMTVIGETRVLPETLDQTWEKLRDALHASK